jgi:hypothetical protein
MVRQLFDNKKQRPVTIDDVETVTGPEEKYEYLEEKAEVSYNGLNFRLFTHRRQPFNSDYIKQRNRMKEDVPRDQPPIQVYEWENGERFVDKGRTAWELWRRWKEGCYNVYWIGGQPPMEYVLKKTWIRKID